MIHDFLIIGGGIAGVSTGAELSRLGSVLLLEAEDALAYHASGRSAALFEAHYGHPVTIELNKASHAFHMTANGGVLSPRGLMFVASATQADSFAQDVAQMHLDEISPDDARAMVPILNLSHLAMAAYHDAAWDIDTDRLLQNYVRAIRDNQGEIRSGAKVTGITRASGLWQVTASGGQTHKARVLVNAAGAWADHIAALAGVHPLGLKPLRRSMARMPAPGGHDVSGWPMVIGSGESWYAKPDAGAWLVSPAEEDPAEPHDAWADDLVLAEGIARYQPFVIEEVTRITATWAGLRTFAPDRCLVLGPAPDNAAFIWVAGQGGYGFQTAPAAARLVGDLLSGRPPELSLETVARLGPGRFA
ncbi:NAD(P)/FAD-dependent oxidoreductase [Rhodophyticola porphyridii]|uniref:FAD-binding oxidoreductase n=1 Tax=Rhodophyticola porphyridii TaxID=1852017 RepID=A0A3L9Y973_9RHOB|nr:FAD-dependent oxidoreductase [Rhodophyticola porphyridii]RMA43838.1 FAD-binding oxidoreductase [Rhodophyticola porphyridii]